MISPFLYYYTWKIFQQLRAPKSITNRGPPMGRAVAGEMADPKPKGVSGQCFEWVGPKMIIAYMN